MADFDVTYSNKGNLNVEFDKEKFNEIEKTLNQN